MIYKNQRKVAKQADHAIQLKAQRDELNLLYSNENRPDLEAEVTGDMSSQPNTYYLISNEFITEWRSMVRSGKYKPIEIQNSSLLCEHAKLIKTSPKE